MRIISVAVALLFGCALNFNSPAFAGELKVSGANGTKVTAVANSPTTCKQVGQNNICGYAKVKPLGTKVITSGSVVFKIPAGFQVCVYSPGKQKKCLNGGSGSITF